MPYRVLIFPGVRAHKKFPMIIAFHGMGMNGESYMRAWEKEAAQRNFMIVTPAWTHWDLQGGMKTRGARLEDLDAAIEEILQHYPVDRKRVYLTGLSAGGIASTHLAQRNPSRWKGLVWMAFSTDELVLPRPGVNPKGFPPILVLHGSKDPFPTGQVQKDWSLLKGHGFHVTWIEDPTAGHEHKPEWTKQIFDWIKNKK